MLRETSYIISAIIVCCEFCIILFQIASIIMRNYFDCPRYRAISWSTVKGIQRLATSRATLHLQSFKLFGGKMSKQPKTGSQPPDEPCKVHEYALMGPQVEPAAGY